HPSPQVGRGVVYRRTLALLLLLLRHASPILTRNAGRDLAGVEVVLAKCDLQEAQDRPALRVELPRLLGDSLRVRLRVQAVEADQELQGLGPPRVAIDPRDGLEGGVAREPRRARKRAVEQEALDHALRGDASGIARLHGLER